MPKPGKFLIVRPLGKFEATIPVGATQATVTLLVAAAFTMAEVRKDFPVPGPP